MGEWHGYEQAEGSNELRPWWRQRGAPYGYERSDGIKLFLAGGGAP